MHPLKFEDMKKFKRFCG